MGTIPSVSTGWKIPSVSIGHLMSTQGASHVIHQNEIYPMHTLCWYIKMRYITWDTPYQRKIHLGYPHGVFIPWGHPLFIPGISFFVITFTSQPNSYKILPSAIFWTKKPWPRVSSLLPPPAQAFIFSRAKGSAFPMLADFHRILVTYALTLSANRHSCKKKSWRRVCTTRWELNTRNWF